MIWILMILHSLVVYVFLHKIRMVFVCFMGNLNFCNSANGIGMYWWYFMYDDGIVGMLSFSLCTTDESKLHVWFICGKYGVEEGPDTLGELNLLGSVFDSRWSVIMDTWMFKYVQFLEGICSNIVTVHSVVWFCVCLTTEQVWWCIGLLIVLTLGSFDDL